MQLSLLLVLAAAGAHAACTSKVGRDLPVATPDAVGISGRIWAEANDAIDAGRHEVRALIVMRDCKVVVERYKSGITRDHNHAVFSVTKSVSSTLVAALLHQGKLSSLDTPVADLVPMPRSLLPEDWQKAKAITLRHAMQMSSGLAWKHDPSMHPIYDTRQDRLALAMRSPQEVPPGTRYLYSDGDATMTGAVIAAVANEDLMSFGRSALFDPLEMTNVGWIDRDRAGRYPSGWGLRLRPIDLAKLGQLYLQKGEWNGKRIFAESFADEAWKQGPGKTYGLHWWIGTSRFVRGAPFFYAEGFKGQLVYVFPTHDAVVVVSASLPSVEVGAVATIVVKALAESVAYGADRSGHPAQGRLKALEAVGFKGEIRVRQTAQDEPKRP